MFELISLVYADLPYRTFFFALEKFWTKFVLLFIKYSYKFTKFYGGLFIAESIQRLKDKKGKREHKDNTHYVIGYSEP